MKLIITFTNYWEAFGGMGQYVKYYEMSQGKTPDNNKLDETGVCEFYTNETIKQWYKDYVKTLGKSHKLLHRQKSLKILRQYCMGACKRTKMYN